MAIDVIYGKLGQFVVRPVFNSRLRHTLKMVLDTSLPNIQQYKVCITGKVEQSRERSSTLPYPLV